MLPVVGDSPSVLLFVRGLRGWWRGFRRQSGRARLGLRRAHRLVPARAFLEALPVAGLSWVVVSLAHRVVLSFRAHYIVRPRSAARFLGS